MLGYWLLDATKPQLSSCSNTTQSSFWTLEIELWSSTTWILLGNYLNTTKRLKLILRHCWRASQCDERVAANSQSKRLVPPKREPWLVRCWPGCVEHDPEAKTILGSTRKNDGRNSLRSMDASNRKMESSIPVGWAEGPGAAAVSFVTSWRMETLMQPDVFLS